MNDHRTNQIEQRKDLEKPARNALWYHLADGCAMSAVILGVVVLLGWGLQNIYIIQLSPAWAVMMPTAAVKFILAGCALWFMRRWRLQNTLATHLAAGVSIFLLLIFSTLLLLGYGSGLSSWLEVFFTSEEILANNKMAPITAFLFLLCAVSILNIPFWTGCRWHPAEILSSIIFFTALTAVAGYLYGVMSLYDVWFYNSIAFHTAIGFMVLSLGIFFSRPTSGLMRILTNRSSRGIVLRRLLPLIVVVPLLLGLLTTTLAHRIGLYQLEFGIALLVVALTAVLFAAVLWGVKELAQVDERKAEAIDQLRASEELFRAVFEQAGVGIAQLTVTGEWLAANKTILEFADFKAGAVKGKKFSEVFRLDVPVDFNDLRRQLVHESSVTIECPFYRQSGKSGWIHLTFSAAEKSNLLVLVAQDVTDRRQAEDKLQELNRNLEARIKERIDVAERRADQLRRLAWQLNHTEQRVRRGFAQRLQENMQQLLAAAKMRLESLRKTTENDTGVPEAFAEINSLISEALEVSRSVSSQLSPAILYDIGLIAGLQWLRRHMQEEYDFNVVVTADSEAEPGNLDLRLFLFQCARELLVNAVHHANTDHAHLDLGRSEDGKSIKLCIEDDGTGFDFETWQNSGESAEGFGLFEIQERMKVLDGKVDVITAPGQGTKIEISAKDRSLRQHMVGSIDWFEPERVKSNLPSSESSDDVEHKYRILIADDHQAMRNLLLQLLHEEPDFEVIGEATTADEAIRSACETKPDVIVMDVSMPGMDGITATGKLHQQLPEVRIIGLSMHHNEDLAEAMLNAGACAYLTKNIDNTELMIAIRKAARAAA